jgi:hypothetical protein
MNLLRRWRLRGTQTLVYRHPIYAAGSLVLPGAWVRPGKWNVNL